MIHFKVSLLTKKNCTLISSNWKVEQLLAHQYLPTYKINIKNKCFSNTKINIVQLIAKAH